MRFFSVLSVLTSIFVALFLVQPQALASGDQNDQHIAPEPISSSRSKAFEADPPRRIQRTDIDLEAQRTARFFEHVDLNKLSQYDQVLIHSESGEVIEIAGEYPQLPNGFGGTTWDTSRNILPYDQAAMFEQGGNFQRTVYGSHSQPDQEFGFAGIFEVGDHLIIKTSDSIGLYESTFVDNEVPQNDNRYLNVENPPDVMLMTCRDLTYTTSHRVVVEFELIYEMKLEN